MTASRVEDGLSKRERELVAEIRALKSRLAGFERNELEQKLNSEHHSSLYHSSNVPMGYVSVEGLFQNVNQAFLEMIGYSREELVGQMSVEDITPQAFLSDELSRVQELLRTGKPQQYDKEYLRKDGSRVPVSLAIFVMRGSDGQALIIGAVAQDLSEHKHSLDALRESEEKYHSIFESANEAVFIIGMDGRIKEANQRASEIYGYTHNELMTINAQELIHPDYFHMFVTHTQVLLEQKYFQTEAINICKDGREIYVNVNATRIEYDGQPCFLNCITDITGRKQAEKDLKTSEQRLELAHDAVGMGMFDWDIVHDEAVCNDRYFRLFGLEPQGRMLSLEDWLALVHPDDRQRAQMEVGQTLDEQAAYRSEYRVVWPDRSVKWVSSIAKVFYDDDGKPRRMIGALTDITERKQAEEKLRQESFMRKTLLDGIPSCFAMVLKKGTREIVASNKAAHEIGAVPGMICHEICAQRDDCCPFCLAPECWDTNEPRRLEVEYRGVYYEGIWVPLTEELYVHYIFNITKRKRAEAQISASLDEKEVLLREIHHRVKNNMQVIVSLLRLHSRRINDARLRQVFDDCRDRINAMSLVHEALYQSKDLARIDFPTYLKKLCRNLGQVYGVPRKGIALTLGQYDVALAMDQCVAIGMVICELVSNAFKHAFPAGKPGSVSVSLARRADEEVELIVQDDGIGLAPAIDIQNTSSLGLKLAVATVTGELGGHIEVERDRGTRYVIHFKCQAS